MFSWDPAKAEANLAKHGISFESAIEVFRDRAALERLDTKHSAEEQRTLVIGRLASGHVVTLAYTSRRTDEGETRRIITARPASSREREAYRRGLPGDP